MPPTFPDKEKEKSYTTRSIFYNMFRPEFVKGYARPLSSGTRGGDNILLLLITLLKVLFKKKNYHGI